MRVAKLDTFLAFETAVAQVDALAGLVELLRTLVALVAAGVLSRTLLRGPRVPLSLGLPPYRLPQPGAVVREMWEKGKVFVTEAGTVILACTVVLWVLLAFPSLPADQEAAFAQERCCRAGTLPETPPSAVTMPP